MLSKIYKTVEGWRDDARKNQDDRIKHGGIGIAVAGLACSEGMEKAYQRVLDLLDEVVKDLKAQIKSRNKEAK